MLGNLYDRALGGERCWIRHDDGRMQRLPVRSWLGGQAGDEKFDRAVVGLCDGPTIDLGCGPGRLVAHLLSAGCRRWAWTSRPPPSHWPAVAAHPPCTAMCSNRCRAPADGTRCCWPTATSAWAATLWRVLQRAGELLRRGGRCVAEFDSVITGVEAGWVRLESSRTIGPWFRWASVGIDCAARLADDVGLALTGVHPIGRRVVASLAVT